MPAFCNIYDSEINVINPCNDELITFNIKVKDCFSIVTNPQGKSQARINLMETGHGTGELGNEYVYNVTLNQVVNLNPNESTEIITGALNNNVIGKGAAPNFVIVDKFHITVTPNGDITVARDIFEIKCRYGV